MIARVAAALLLTVALPASAQEITRSPVPPENPAYLVQTPATMPDVAAAEKTVAPKARPAEERVASLRPQPRPKGLEAVVAARRAEEAGKGLDLAAAAKAAEPEPVAEPAPKGKKKKKKEKVSAKGSVCGVAAIKGEPIAPITSKIKGCGLADGVRVTSVSGVRLSMAITVDCATAKALNTWIDQVVQPAYGNAVVEVKIAGHYICRSRNNVKGAKVSEHGRGKAVDIGGFVLSDGQSLTVVKNYNKTMRKVHKQACGLFGTTLGPGSDGYHEDHLHLDTASHRSPYCR